MRKQTIKSKVSVRTVICALLIIIGISSFSSMRVNATTVSYDSPSFSSLTPHASISITSDIELEAFPGLGTAEDPYVIEGYNITTTDNNGIYIAGTTKYFTIRNCYVEAKDNGIYIYAAANGTTKIINNACNNNEVNNIYIRFSHYSVVVDNLCENSGNGINLDYSEYSTIVNNTCNNNIKGIYLDHASFSVIQDNECNNNSNQGIYSLWSGNSTIYNNTCNHNLWEGIYLDQSSDFSTIANNTCNNNIQDSIKLCSSSYCFVINNTCYNNSRGIYVLYSEYSTIANNTFTNSFEGVFMDQSSHNIVADNICIDNDQRGIFLWFTSNSIVTENTCNNNGDDGIAITYSDNTTISNNTCNYNDADGINLRYSDFSTLKGNICNSNTGYEGISIEISNNSTISYNICNNNLLDGIKLQESVNGTISNNICIDNGFDGIEARDSGNVSISENTCNYNGWEGIILENSDNGFITNNTCAYNYYAGIYIGNTNSSTIYKNTCENNQDGIQLWYSHFQNITYNILRDNMDNGIQIDSNSDNNSLHHNNFVNNHPGSSSQARDSGSNNLWYDTEKLEGNYWSDWSGIGPYAIDGFVGAVDLYPLNEPTVYLGPPVIIDVINSPVSATELDTIEIEARVTSPYGVQTVSLHYRVNGGTWIEVSMSLVSGDLYSCTIGTFAVDDIIEFYINATDVTIEHNIAINDNSGVYYSFTIIDSVVIPEFQSHSILILSTIVFLFSFVCLVIKKQRRK